MWGSKTEVLAYLKDRVWKRIQGWKEKKISWTGKEVMIKAVAQAIPTFPMGCSDLTKSLCDQISMLICRYWWNQQEGKHKVHWICWNLIKDSLSPSVSPELYSRTGRGRVLYHGIKVRKSRV
jgi:hypothetical protein